MIIINFHYLMKLEFINSKLDYKLKIIFFHFQLLKDYKLKIEQIKKLK